MDRYELNKILLSEKPSDEIRRLYEVGILQQSMPELSKCFGFNQNNPHHNKTVIEHILRVVDSVEPKLFLRLAALFYDIGKPNCYSEDKIEDLFNSEICVFNSVCMFLIEDIIVVIPSLYSSISFVSSIIPPPSFFYL